MTIEEVIGMSADELEKMTQADYVKYFAEKLVITRPSPELRAKNSNSDKTRAPKEKLSVPHVALKNLTPEQIARGKALAAQMGLDNFDFMKDIE